MLDNRTQKYADTLAQLIRMDTTSYDNQTDKTAFYHFHKLLKEKFPNIFSVVEYEDFSGSFLLKWKGESSQAPILLMNHHDVVAATGNWRFPPFSAEIADGKIWGRGTLDDKGGLWAMLQAADELASEGFVPKRDIYFVSTCTEEQTGLGADIISAALKEKGLRFDMVLDEGGMIVFEPIAGAIGKYAMVGVGEKGCVNLKFTARSEGGHASTPENNTPLVRLGKFMAEVDNGKQFKSELSPTVCTTFNRISKGMKGPVKFLLENAKMFKHLLSAVIPKISAAAGAMLKTTIAFTMCSGSTESNVLPESAWVLADMRYSHHQGSKDSIRVVTEIAKKYDIETEIVGPVFDSPLSDTESYAFKTVENAIARIFPDVITAPYIMTGASDSRYFSRVCDNCIRFSPFTINNEQLDSVHAVNENLDLDCLAPAVDFYRLIITEA
ncbi:MAG: M20/M25/M40 family metallo-hydrolase [Clostridia bacterium]|nr:M20/M25/M40 family metallo-hydrolase [Clostridia bacterium]